MWMEGKQGMCEGRERENEIMTERTDVKIRSLSRHPETLRSQTREKLFLGIFYLHAII